MRFTKRVRDRYLTTGAAAAAVIGVLGSLTNCSSSEEPRGNADDPADSAVPSETGTPKADATVDVRAPNDAGPFDGAAPPIVCEGPTCVMAISTTRGRFSKDFNGGYQEDPAEGYCALFRDGTVSCWGANGNGQLGRVSDVTVTESVSPARVDGVTDVVALEHTCTLDRQGAVRCWGNGPFLRGGQGSISTEWTAVTLPLPAATRMSIGFEVGCVIAEGKLTCWGANGGGQIDPDMTLSVLPPREIALPAGAPLRDVVVGGATFVIHEDGTALSWGSNPPLGRLSTLFPDPYPQPIDLSNVFAIGFAHQDACAIVGGVGHCWGMSAPKGYGDVGKPLIRRALPEAIVTPEPIRQIATTDTTVKQYEYVARPSRWCATGVSGVVYCFGANGNGQVGDGTQEYALEAVKVTLPAPVVEVKVAPTSTCALVTNGKVFCWGSNFYGQLGSGKLKSPSFVPKEVVFP